MNLRTLRHTLAALGAVIVAVTTSLLATEARP